MPRRLAKSQFAALKARFLLGRYHRSSHALDASRNPTKPGTFSCLKTDPPLRQVAGSAVDVRPAAIGADDALKQADRANRRHWVKAGSGALIQEHHAPINVIGGFKLANAPVIDLGTVPTARSDPTPQPTSPEGDGLDIPGFLARTQPEPPAAHDQSENAQSSLDARMSNSGISTITRS
jgi:hypothetical protein